jgi:hypothetical protein
MDAARDALERDLMMKMGRRRQPRPVRRHRPRRPAAAEGLIHDISVRGSLRGFAAPARSERRLRRVIARFGRAGRIDEWLRFAK